MKKQYIRKCPNCGDELIYSSISSFSHCKNTICRKCANKYRESYCGKANHKWGGYNGISLSYFNQIKKNAKKRNISFNLTIEDLWNVFVLQNEKCVFTGIKLELPKRTRKGCFGNASVDRINSSVGYIKENIQWVHKDVNYMKQDFDQKYFIELCKKISENDDVKNLIPVVNLSMINFITNQEKI